MPTRHTQKEFDELVKEAKELGIGLVREPPTREIDLDYVSSSYIFEAVQRYAKDYGIPVEEINFEKDCYDEDSKHWLSAATQKIDLSKIYTEDAFDLIKLNLIPAAKSTLKREAQEKEQLLDLIKKYGVPTTDVNLHT